MQQKDDVEALLDEGMPFAQEQLSQDGDFQPFSVVMNQSGAIELAGASTGADQPDSDDLAAEIVARLRAVATSDRLIATAVFKHVALTDRETQQKIDAIAADLEHRGGYTVAVVFPYEVESDGTISVHDPIAMPLEPVVFDAAGAAPLPPGLRAVPGALAATKGDAVIYNILTPHMQQFLGRCIGALRKAGLIAKGTGQFSILVGERQVEVALSEFYQSSDDPAHVQNVVEAAKRAASGAM